MKKLTTIQKSTASSIARMLVVSFGAFDGARRVFEMSDGAVDKVADCDGNIYEVRYLTEADLDLISSYLYQHIDRVKKFLLVDELLIP